MLCSFCDFLGVIASSRKASTLSRPCRIPLLFHMKISGCLWPWLGGSKEQYLLNGFAEKLVLLGWRGTCLKPCEESTVAPINLGTVSSVVRRISLSLLTVSLSIFRSVLIVFPLASWHYRDTSLQWFITALYCAIPLHPFQFFFHFQEQWDGQSPGGTAHIGYILSSNRIWNVSVLSRLCLLNTMPTSSFMRAILMIVAWSSLLAVVSLTPQAPCLCR